MTYAAVEQAALAHHLTILGGFHPAPQHGLPNTVQTLVLLGPCEPGFWAHFTAQPEYLDGQADPMDRWSTRVLDNLAGSLGATPYFPFGGPPFQPFISWAYATGRAHGSPVSLLVHDVAGLFVSYRGALAFSHRIAQPPPPENPCDSCADQPCAVSCPVGALGGPTYNVAACKADLDRAGNTCMMQGCAARRACPISQRYGRVSEHSAFHMEHFK